MRETISPIPAYVVKERLACHNPNKHKQLSLRITHFIALFSPLVCF
jgi:hypothetical protein